jgi:hypothetical protein
MSLIARLLVQPNRVFEQLANTSPPAWLVFLKFALVLGVLPPLFLYFGATRFGWRLGEIEPVRLSSTILVGISVAYFAALLFGFVSTAFVSRWMATTYGARSELGVHLSMMTIIGAPLAVGSIVHLYPDAFINMLVLVPVLIWSMTLLYRGLPVVLHTGPERGMLMASSLIGYLLVAAVSLLGITVALWSAGLGPRLGV